MRITYSLKSEDFPFVVQPSEFPVTLNFDNGGPKREVRKRYHRRTYSNKLKALIIGEARKTGDLHDVAKKHNMPAHTLYMWLRARGQK